MRKRSLNPALVGMLTMCVAMSGIGLVDATAKQVALSYNGIQVAWGYFAGMFLSLAIYAAISGQRWSAIIATRALSLQLARAVLIVASLACLFYSFTYLPLADATVVSFTAPLFIASLAGPLLGERVGWQRWAAVVAGLVGAVVVIRPGSSLFQWAAVLPLVGALFFGLFSIVTRKIGTTDRALTSLFYTSFGACALLSFAVPFVWRTPTLNAWLLFLLAGALGLGSHLLIVRAMQLAHASAVAPLNYVRIVWAVGIGYFWFGDTPDTLTITGGAIIIGSGLFTIYREARAA